jgi:hypothetical protein
MATLPLSFTTVTPAPKRFTAFSRATLAFRLEGLDATWIAASFVKGSMVQSAYMPRHSVFPRQIHVFHVKLNNLSRSIRREIIGFFPPFMGFLSAF